MARKDIGIVPIELDRTRYLKFDWNAISEFENAMNCTWIEFFFSLMKKDSDGNPIADINESGVGAGSIEMKALGLKHLRALLWAGLLHQDPSITLKKAGDLIESINADNFADRLNKLTPLFEALMLTMSGPQPKKKVVDHERDAGTGKS
jgi:hypothetical protein